MPHAFGAVYRHIFLPPVNRAMRVLDRTFFKKQIKLPAAHVAYFKDEPKVKRELVHDVLDAPRIKPWVTAKYGVISRTLLLLRPGIVLGDPRTYTPKMKEFLSTRHLQLYPYNMDLEYDYWTFDEILGSILPEELGIPERKFESVGGIGNLIIGPDFLPYKELIAQVLLDKTPQLRAVVMKRFGGEVNGDPSITSLMEHLCGDENPNVEMVASNSRFKFNFNKCYWDSQMSFPNLSLTKQILKKEVVVDVAAGVGHLSIPIAKKKVWVFANDPDKNNYNTMKNNIVLNRVGDYCHPFNLPTRDFIPFIIREIARRSKDPSANIVYIPSPHFVQKHKGPPPPGKNQLRCSPHRFIVNIRAGGISTLSAFKDAYKNAHISDTLLPLIHVHIRQEHGDTKLALREVSRMISEELGVLIEEKDIKLELLLKNTRPTRLMRATFRLPRDVMITKRTNSERRKLVRQIREGKHVGAVEEAEDRKNTIQVDA